MPDHHAALLIGANALASARGLSHSSTAFHLEVKVPLADQVHSIGRYFLLSSDSTLQVTCKRNNSSISYHLKVSCPYLSTFHWVSVAVLVPTTILVE